MAEHISYNPNPGGDGISGFTGLESRTLYNRQHKVAMGNVKFIPEDFVWANKSGTTPSDEVLGLQNSVVKILYDHDLGGADINLPEGVMLWFDGGRLLNVGSLIGNATKIYNPKNIQAFDLNVNIDGSWEGVKGCIQWFGGVSNQSKLTYENDIAPYLSKLLSARWGVFFLHGNYYIGSTIEILYPVTIELGGTSRRDSVLIQNPPPTGGWASTPASKASESVRLYSNLDIDWFHVKMPYVNILGGIFDNTGASVWNHSMIYIHGDWTVEHCKFSQIVLGSSAHVRTEGATGKYFFYETTGATLASHFYKIFIDSDIFYQPIGIEIQEMQEGNHPNAWSNTINVKGLFYGCKKSLIHNAASWANIQIVTQPHDCLAESEKDYYEVELKGYPVIADIFCWDLTGTYYAATERYFAKNPILNKSYGLILTGSSILSDRLRQFHGIRPMAANHVDTTTDLKIFKDNYGGSVFISELHNYFMDWDKKEVGNTVTIKAKSGAGFDFDTEMEEDTALDSSNITIYNAENLVSSLGGASNNLPTQYKFVDAADIEVDFIEITFKRNLDSLMRVLRYYVYYNGHQTGIKRFQFIGKKSDDTYVVVNESGISMPTRNYFKVENSSLTEFKKVVIRLIGVESLDKTIEILDIAAQRGENTPIYLPRINEFKYKYTAIISQSGDSAPVVDGGAPRLNTFPRTITYHYNSVGNYYMRCTGYLDANKILPIKETVHIYDGPSTFVGTVRMSRVNGDDYRIETWDSEGNPANGILTNFCISFERGW